MMTKRELRGFRDLETVGGGSAQNDCCVNAGLQLSAVSDLRL
jgi:hypothetical protein